MGLARPCGVQAGAGVSQMCAYDLYPGLLYVQPNALILFVLVPPTPGTTFTRGWSGPVVKTAVSTTG